MCVSSLDVYKKSPLFVSVRLVHSTLVLLYEHLHQNVPGTHQTQWWGTCAHTVLTVCSSFVFPKFCGVNGTRRLYFLFYTFFSS